MNPVHVSHITGDITQGAQVEEMSQPFDQTPWFGAFVGAVSSTIIGKIFRLLRAPDRDDLTKVARAARADVAAAEVRTAGALVALENRFKETVKEIKEDGEARTSRIESQIAVGFAGMNGRIDGLVDKRRGR